jgi:GNAT superfamily N-acetyltransferase
MNENRAKDYWSETFGLISGEFSKSGTRVIQHGGRLSGPKAWVFTHGESCLVSVPEKLVTIIRGRLTGVAIDRVHDEENIQAIFGDLIDSTIGPSYQGYLEREGFRRFDDPHVRRIRFEEKAKLHALKESCSTGNWEESGIDTDDPVLFGYFLHDEIVAASGFISWSKDAANPALIAHPDHRGKGFGKAVASAVIEHILDQGKIVLYQTLLSNTSAVRIAESLGCRMFGMMTFIHLKGKPANG